MCKNTFILLILLFLPLQVNSQENHKIDVKIKYQSDPNDIIGDRLVYNVKEYFRKSQRFQLVDYNTDVVIIIMTGPPPFGERSIQTIYAVIWTMYWDCDFPIYINSFVAISGTDRIYEAAEGIVADTDKIITNAKKKFKIFEDKRRKEIIDFLNAPHDSL